MFCINCWTRACGWRSKHERERTGECNSERSAAFHARFDTDDAAGSVRQGGGAVGIPDAAPRIALAARGARLPGIENRPIRSRCRGTADGRRIDPAVAGAPPKTQHPISFFYL